MYSYQVRQILREPWDLTIFPRNMVRSLNFPVEVRICDTIREIDGLAMSSRNRNDLDSPFLLFLPPDPLRPLSGLTLSGIYLQKSE